MSQPPTVAAGQDPATSTLARHEATIRAELTRCEAKAAALLTAAGLLLPVIVAGASIAHIRPAAAVLGMAAAGVDAAVVVGVPVRDVSPAAKGVDLDLVSERL